LPAKPVYSVNRNMRMTRHLPNRLAEHAYDAIRNKILKGELSLGAAISRRELAGELGMSFVPVSEAIQRLESEGLVESRPRAGTRVRVPTARDVRERHILREALEVQSARLFAEKASADERIELLSMAAHLDALMAESAGEDRDREFRFNLQAYHLSLHKRIAECAGCSALCEAINKNQLLIFNWLYDSASRIDMPPLWHTSLVKVVAGRDPDRAEVAMRRHVRHGMEEVQARIASHSAENAAEFSGMQRARAGTWRVKPKRTPARQY